MQNHPSQPSQIVLAQHTMSLEKRYSNPSVNKVFKDNILLTLAYMDNKVKDARMIDWTDIEKPATYSFTLDPHKSFAFHDYALSSVQPTIAATTNAHFDAQEGYISDGYLYGDGVCHLASLMYWAAKDAKLTALAPTPHDFAVIPEIPKEYGVAIYDEAGADAASQQQNLYITNTFNNPVTFSFTYDENGELTTKVLLDNN